MQFLAASFAKRKISNYQIWVFKQLFHTKVPKAHEKEEKKKVEIERFFKKHVKCTKTVNETNKENAEVLSPQSPQSSNDSTIDLTEKSSPKSKAESTSTTYQQTTIDHGISASDIVKAEIIWTVAGGFSNNSAKDLHSTFETKFPDSAIASNFHVGPEKLKYMTNWGIAPYVKEQLKNSIDKAEYVLISFDESLNHITQSCQMDLLLRYWDNHDQQVKARYWDSKFLGHTTNKDLLIEFNKSVDIIDLSKIIQVSMDGPSVNLKFMQELIKHREELEIEEKMIDIGTCGLHVVHGAFKCGIESTEWKIKETLKGSHQLLHDTPARRADYVSVTQSSE